MTERTSTTRRDLLRLRLGLLGLTVVVLALSVWSFASTQAVLTTVRTQTAPAVLDVASARAALTQAHAAAVNSFVNHGADLVGPGQRYTTDLSVAEQDLARAAGDNAGDQDASSTLQLIAGLLTTYGDWMSQAGTHYRADTTRTLSLTDLWYAQRSLTGDGQVLDQLRDLAVHQRQVLAQQVGEGWLDPVTVLAWAAPALALLGLLVHVQVYLWRKFGRRFNLGLVGASVLLVVLMAATASGLVLAGRARAATEDLTTYVTRSDAQAQDVSQRAQHDLIAQVRTACGDSCGDTLAAADEAQPTSVTPPVDPPSQAAADATAQYADATDLGWLLVAIPVLALGVAALGLVGLQPRIDEYRYRS